MSYCNSPMRAHTCWDDCSKRPSILWRPRQAPASCSWDRRAPCIITQTDGNSVAEVRVQPRPILPFASTASDAPGNHSLVRRQSLPAVGRRRLPGFRTKTLRSGNSRYSLRHCTRRCCRHGRTHMSCAEPQSHVICLPERVEPPDSGAIRHSAIRMSCSTEWSGPAKSWPSSRTT